ncbi:hypothetical protein [Herbiconiux sp.]|uniref:hypothetical protein n=1 Tax=Herbiconiux sp. TaxID=1871186 RepID=UPI0025C402DD|nr:hypothetical protein [Herbiconiux sp.]
MMISEFSFGWLHEAEEERFARELEQRRVIAERAAEDDELRRETRPGSRAHGSGHPLRRARRRLSAADGTM